MIIYIFNHYFPDPSGFGRRIMREIQALSKIDDIIIICRRSDNDAKVEFIKSSNKSIKIVRYDSKVDIVHRPTDYSGSGLYEIKRNLGILFQTFFTLIREIRKQKNRRSVRVYAVSSPLTIPIIALCSTVLTGTEATLVSFHDLEPELAMHIKRLPSSHWIVRLEFFLEKFVCQQFKKVLVTTEGQANRIHSRTGVPEKQICSIPNTSDLNILETSNEIDKDPERLILGYLSTLSFDYTVEGLKKFLAEVPRIKKLFPKFEFRIIGGGDSFESLRKLVADKNIQSYVHLTGHINNPQSELFKLDAAIIPWEKDIMTETMLPTKLFEYLSLGIPVIAPNFGEFKRTLTDRYNALLFDSFGQIQSTLQLIDKNSAMAFILRKNGKELFQREFSVRRIEMKLIQFIQT